MLELEIQDNDEGITQEQESKIFELSYRGGNKLTRTTQGTGIALDSRSKRAHCCTTWSN